MIKNKENINSSEYIVFLDDEGQSFSVDNKNYIFWFKEKTSVNLFNTKKIFVLSSLENLTVSCEKNQDKIELVDSNDFINMSDEKYILNNNIHTVTSYNSKGNKIGEIDEYLPLSQAYLHCIYFIAHSDIPGIFEVDFNINNNNYKIACDFDEKEESLGINLNNMGVNFPDLITSAINTTDPEEIFPDQNLLNIKLKELLFEYMHIIGNMGSYDSLINGLKWFGYGDNIKIYEFWKNSLSKKYDISDIQDRLYETLNYLIKYYQKTTYIALFYLLNRIKRDNNNNIIYEKENIYTDKMRWAEFIAPPGQSELDMPEGTPEWFNFTNLPISSPIPDNWPHWHKFIKGRDNGSFLPEPVPVLDEVSWNYNLYELYLKMSLLSKYFQKYFMPVHLDLYDVISTTSVFKTIKNLQYGKYTQLNNVNIMGLDNISYTNIDDKFYVNDCTAWINQSNTWNTFTDIKVGYYGPIYNTKPGETINLFNENTIENNIPLVFITSDNNIEKQIINDPDIGLKGFYIITDCGVKIPISYKYNKNNIYQKYELYIYFSSEYNVEWPTDWSTIPTDEKVKFNRYKFEKNIIENPYKPVDEVLNIFVNRQGHYLFQSVFTDYYGTQTVINKAIDVYPSKIDFELYKLTPIKDIFNSNYIEAFEGINYVSKVAKVNKDTDNYIGYASGEPIKGSYSFDFLNKDYFNNVEYNSFDYNKYSSELFFFASNNENANKNSILMTNHILFIKLNELYGDKKYYDDNNYYIKYSPNIIFKGKDKNLKLNNKYIYNLNSLKINFSDYIWTLKEGDKTFGDNLEWNTILIGIKKTFGKGFNTDEEIASDLNPNFEWYSQYRFILDLYKLEKIPANQTISPYTLIYLKPNIENTYFAEENNKVLPKWIIENESIFYNIKTNTYDKRIPRLKKRNNYIFSSYNDIYHYNAEPGYYSITYQCKLVQNGTNVSIKKKNILKIEKED